MLELYQAYADYTDMMALAEDLFAAAAKAATGGTTVTFGEHRIEFGGRFRRAPMTELVKEATGVDFLQIEGAEAAREAAKKPAAQGQREARTGARWWSWCSARRSSTR